MKSILLVLSFMSVGAVAQDVRMQGETELYEGQTMQGEGKQYKWDKAIGGDGIVRKVEQKKQSLICTDEKSLSIPEEHEAEYEVFDKQVLELAAAYADKEITVVEFRERSYKLGKRFCASLIVDTMESNVKRYAEQIRSRDEKKAESLLKRKQQAELDAKLQESSFASPVRRGDKTIPSLEDRPLETAAEAEL